MCLMSVHWILTVHHLRWIDQARDETKSNNHLGKVQFEPETSQLSIYKVVRLIARWKFQEVLLCLSLLACLRFTASCAFLLRRVCSRPIFPLGYVWEQLIMVGSHSTSQCRVCMGCHGYPWAPVRLRLLLCGTWSTLISTDRFYHVLASNVCPLNTDGTSIKAPTVSCAAFSNCLEIVSLSCTKELR